MVKKLFFSQQFIRFMLVGGVAALVNFGSRIVFSMTFSFRWAVVLAYIIGMLTAYILSKYFVFELSGKSAIEELYRFVLVNLFAIAQVWLISIALAEYLFPMLEYAYYAEELAHFIGLLIPVITSYLGHKHFTFSQKNAPDNR